MAPRALTALALTAALLAGCGGDDDSATGGGGETKRLDRVEACLEKQYPGFVSSEKPDLDRIAAVAKEGGVAVHTEDQEINVSLLESPRAARAAERVYRGYDSQPGLLERRGTVVVAYTREPTRREREQIAPCISG